MQEARKKQVKGRAMGGMISGVRRELVAEEKRDREGEEKEGAMVCRVKIGKEIVAVVCVYRRRGEEEREVLKRKSKHKEIDQEGRKLLNLIGETAWFICNGNSRGDEEGEITFTGRGDTGIDYILAEERIRRLMVKLEVGNEIGSEHFPVVTTLRGKGKKRDRRGKGGVGKRKVKMGL